MEELLEWTILFLLLEVFFFSFFLSFFLSFFCLFLKQIQKTGAVVFQSGNMDLVGIISFQFLSILPFHSPTPSLTEKLPPLQILITNTKVPRNTKTVVAGVRFVCVCLDRDHLVCMWLLF